MDEHRAGPRRSEQARLAVLGAAAELLAERGYENLTIEAIARRAGVGKQTIYRWWSSRAAILSEALLEGLIFRHQLSVRDTGDLRHDLAEWMQRVSGILDAPEGRVLLRSLLAAATEDPAIGALLRDQLSADGGVRARVVAHGDAGLPADDVGDAIAGWIVLQALMGSSPTPDSIRSLVRTLVPG
ncbi:TetR/AcrR family transcriptional regulator [Microbacterium oleivorans]|uniref:TetR/AcrR family transcriptional regulator n=1 Tax=Microbacterium oleivorans TaxID=273677 RepID=A0A7D5JZP0_9MICO|nr:TetR/AcrR family transcriptional regulator [Microbacterium oleivorans]QLD12443.1 TetR/AcrR family transcriptional regulator [Microbacterium oleivorans]